MNHDRIADVYEGRFGDRRFQEVARRRIHWLCSHGGAGRVLDLGCSQGIASVLVARAGRTVIGVDREAVAIDAARELAEREPEAVRRRLDFRLAEGTRLPFKANSFGTVLLGEVLEHQTNPSRILRSAFRVLAPEGRLVVTVPYGLFRYHDHKTTMYADGLLAALEALGEVLDITLIDRYLGVVAVKRTPTPASALVLRAGLRIADARVAQLDEILDRSTSTASLDRQASGHEGHELARELEALKLRADALEKDLAESQLLERKARSDAEMSQLNAHRAEAERDELARRLKAASAPLD